MTSPRVNTVHLRLKRALSNSVPRVDTDTLGMAGGKQQLSPKPVLARTVSAPPQAPVLSGLIGSGTVAHADLGSPRTRGRWWFANKQRRTIEEFSGVGVDLKAASEPGERVRALAACHCPMHVRAPFFATPSIHLLTWMGLGAREGVQSALSAPMLAAGCPAPWNRPAGRGAGGGGGRRFGQSATAQEASMDTARDGQRHRALVAIAESGGGSHS